MHWREKTYIRVIDDRCSSRTRRRVGAASAERARRRRSHKLLVGVEDALLGALHRVLDGALAGALLLPTQRSVNTSNVL